MWSNLLTILSIFIPLNYCYKENIFPILMPHVKPSRPELYLCTPVRVNPEESYYITSFEPNATMATAHHMLLYGCQTPGSKKAVWNCGEMAGSSVTDGAYESASPCGEGAQVIFAWAMDAPKYELPEGVGFKVGKDTPIQYLVLQVHYANVDRFKDGSTDESGIFLQYTSRPLNKLAGVLLLVTAGAIPPLQTEYMETSCEMNEDKVIHPVAFRTHTHKLGKVVAGYKVLKNNNGGDEWVQLGKRSPQTPQMFYPVSNTDPIRRGDVLAARCTMKNTHKKWVFTGSNGRNRKDWARGSGGKKMKKIPHCWRAHEGRRMFELGDSGIHCTTWDGDNGSMVLPLLADTEVSTWATRDDEMCNFYLLYYVEGAAPLERKYCFSPGPPNFYWGKSDGLNNIPDKEASSLGSNET